MGEFILELFGRWILAGIWYGLNTIYDWIKGKITGVPKNKVEQKRLEKKWLYKKVILTRKLENGIETGTNGTVMEIIDNKIACVEFYDKNGDFVEIDTILMFSVKFYKLKLKK